MSISNSFICWKVNFSDPYSPSQPSCSSEPTSSIPTPESSRPLLLEARIRDSSISKQGGEQVHLVGRNEHRDGRLVLALGRRPLLQKQQHVVEIGSCGRKSFLLAESSCVNHEDNSFDLLRASELAHRDVAKLSVARGIDQEKLCVRARGVVEVAERGLGSRVGRGVELDRVRDLRGVRLGRVCAALEEGHERRLAGVVGAQQEDAGRDGV
ncbi:hypothetical protein MKX08_009681 [Trichoderma sp. CBMAI-0020]|nr:hypothetical protein MKX08_009681 [Trichoderma sp. CBMAI-0020]